ncbi:MAG: cation transporter, partial [Deltaproteobacteria bacterium]|nr:cation transporter [Deltaproteobacteria bacterium]
IGGFYSHSLALLSDAGHLFTDLFTLLMSFFAILIAQKPVNENKTYGYYRAEVIAAFLNGILLSLVSFFIFYEAFQRWTSKESPHAISMFWISLLGLIMNLISGALLFRLHSKSLNLKGAFFHILSDTLSSVGVVAGALLIYYRDLNWLDPLLSILIGTLVLFWALRLLRESIHILMESTPKHLSIESLKLELKKEFPEIIELHQIHLWEITTHRYALTAHLLTHYEKISECQLLVKRMRPFLCDKFQIEHINFQFENP